VRSATVGLLAQHDETRDNRTMRGFLASLTIVAALAAPASAELLRLSAEVQAGGVYGQGTSGDQKDNAFFAVAPHFTYGVGLAAELFIFDAWIQHQQFTEFSGSLVTFTQFGLGLHHTFDLGTEQEKKQHKGDFFELGIGAFLGLGTDAPVKPPLNHAQLSDQGFMGEARVGYGKHLDSVFDIAVEVPVSYGAFTKPNDTGCSANNLSCSYQSWQIEALVVFRANLRLL
jgi:hypothetical protein